MSLPDYDTGTNSGGKFTAAQEEHGEGRCVQCGTSLTEHIGNPNILHPFVAAQESAPAAEREWFVRPNGEHSSNIAARWAWKADEPRANGWAWIRDGENTIAEMPHSLAQDICRKQSTAVVCSILAATASPEQDWPLALTQASVTELQRQLAQARQRYDEVHAIAVEKDRLWSEVCNERNAAQAACKAKDEHCRDCCCSQSWAALGITEYTGKSIPEHIAELKAKDETPCPYCGQ